MNLLPIGLAGAALLAGAPAQDQEARPAPPPPRVRIRDILVEVPGPITIVKLVPEGTIVARGDVLLELDASGLRDNLMNQQIAAERARGAAEDATKVLQAAELAVREYVEGSFRLEQLRIRGELTLAESDLRHTIERLEWARRMQKNQAIGEDQVIELELAKQKAEIARDVAAKANEVLENYTRPRRITELQTAVEQARADQLARLATLKLEQAKIERIERWIERCRVVAPCAGVVVYVPPTRPGQPPIEEGGVVRERQRVLRVVPTQPEG